MNAPETIADLDRNAATVTVDGTTYPIVGWFGDDAQPCAPENAIAIMFDDAGQFRVGLIGGEA
jgi:hypothetical protein